jgi:nitrite reductase/ring-hydroxylating ferredoxin subunit
MAEWIEVMQGDSLDDPGTRGVELPGTTRSGAAFFVALKDGEWRAYRNSCPHTGAPMEWVPHEFLDLDRSFIQCALHGALFRVGDGMCLAGPCAGQSLQALPLRLDAQGVWVDVSTLHEID